MPPGHSTTTTKVVRWHNTSAVKRDIWQKEGKGTALRRVTGPLLFSSCFPYLPLSLPHLPSRKTIVKGRGLVSWLPFPPPRAQV